VFVADRIRREVKRRGAGVYVFRVIDEGDQLAWFFANFDIKSPRKPGYEYAVVMREMFFNLCARVDRSTYIYPERVGVDGALALAGVEANREAYYVVLNDERATAHLREAIVSEVKVSESEAPKSPLSYIRSALADMIASVERTDRRANRVRVYAKQLHARVRGVLELTKRCRVKFGSIGLDPAQELEIESLLEALELAVMRKWG
jgi:hypothetical protein